MNEVGFVTPLLPKGLFTKPLMINLDTYNDTTQLQWLAVRMDECLLYFFVL